MASIVLISLLLLLYVPIYVRTPSFPGEIGLMF